MTDFDVAIVGAGPSGSTTAYHLAKAGARVLLVDRARFPRDKPCGGGVTSRAYAESPVDLTPVVEQQVTKVRFSFRLGESFDYEWPRTLVYMTQRHRLDAYLADQAAKAGADFQDGTMVRSVAIEDDGIRLDINGTSVGVKAMVGADGHNGVVARAAGLHPVNEPLIALEANFPYARVPSEWQSLLALELGSLDGGYGWSFPKADHFNVGCGGFHNEGVRLREHLASLRQHYDLGEVQPENIRGHHLPTRTEGSPIVRGPVLLTGDAAGLVDPMSGEGIYAAFVSGRLAAQTVGRYLEGQEQDLEGYEASIERDLMPDIRAARVMCDAYHYTPRPCYVGLRYSQMLRRYLCQTITGERTYDDLFRTLGPLVHVLRYWARRGRRRPGFRASLNRRLGMDDVISFGANKDQQQAEPEPQDRD